MSQNKKNIKNSGKLSKILTSKIKRPQKSLLELNRSENRSLKLHQEISLRLNERSLQEWTPRIEKNIIHLEEKIQGEPHLSNLERWKELILDKDLYGLHRVLTGLDRSSIEMREVSPMLGVITEKDRLQILSSSKTPFKSS